MYLPFVPYLYRYLYIFMIWNLWEGESGKRDIVGMEKSGSRGRCKTFTREILKTPGMCQSYVFIYDTVCEDLKIFSNFQG
jgi:hypothetical protein